MKKYFAVFLTLGFLFSAFPNKAQESEKKNNKTETVKKRKSKQKLTKDSAVITDISDAQAVEQRKKEIEAKEQSVDKNKKVKRLTVDENLPETIRNRNIP